MMTSSDELHLAETKLTTPQLQDALSQLQTWLLSAEFTLPNPAKCQSVYRCTDSGLDAASSHFFVALGVYDKV